MFSNYFLIISFVAFLLVSVFLYFLIPVQQLLSKKVLGFLKEKKYNKLTTIASYYFRFWNSKLLRWFAALWIDLAFVDLLSTWSNISIPLQYQQTFYYMILLVYFSLFYVVVNKSIGLYLMKLIQIETKSLKEEISEEGINLETQLEQVNNKDGNINEIEGQKENSKKEVKKKGTTTNIILIIISVIVLFLIGKGALVILLGFGYLVYLLIKKGIFSKLARILLFGKGWLFFGMFLITSLVFSTGYFMEYGNFQNTGEEGVKIDNNGNLLIAREDNPEDYFMKLIDTNEDEIYNAIEYDINHDGFVDIAIDNYGNESVYDYEDSLTNLWGIFVITCFFLVFLVIYRYKIRKTAVVITILVLLTNTLLQSFQIISFSKVYASSSDIVRRYHESYWKCKNTWECGGKANEHVWYKEFYENYFNYLVSIGKEPFYDEDCGYGYHSVVMNSFDSCMPDGVPRNLDLPLADNTSSYSDNNTNNNIADSTNNTNDNSTNDYNNTTNSSTNTDDLQSGDFRVVDSNGNSTDENTDNEALEQAKRIRDLSNNSNSNTNSNISTKTNTNTIGTNVDDVIKNIGKDTNYLTKEDEENFGNYKNVTTISNGLLARMVNTNQSSLRKIMHLYGAESAVTGIEIRSYKSLIHEYKNIKGSNISQSINNRKSEIKYKTKYQNKVINERGDAINENTKKAGKIKALKKTLGYLGDGISIYSNYYEYKKEFKGDVSKAKEATALQYLADKTIGSNPIDFTVGLISAGLSLAGAPEAGKAVGKFTVSDISKNTIKAIYTVEYHEFSDIVNETFSNIDKAERKVGKASALVGASVTTAYTVSVFGLKKGMDATKYVAGAVGDSVSNGANAVVSGTKTVFKKIGKIFSWR